MTDFTFRSIYEALSSFDQSNLSSFGMNVADQYETEGYGIYLVKLPSGVEDMCGAKYQLGLNKTLDDKQTSFTDHSNQDKKYVKFGEKFPLHILKDFIEKVLVWIDRYDSILVSSANATKFETYKKLFNKFQIEYKYVNLFGQDCILLVHKNNISEAILVENEAWFSKQYVDANTQKPAVMKIIDTDHAIQRELQRGIPKQEFWEAETGMTREEVWQHLANKITDYYIRNRFELIERYMKLLIKAKKEGNDEKSIRKKTEFFFYSNKAMQGVVVSFRPDDFEKRFRDFQIFVVTVYPPGSVSEKQKNETKFVRIESIDSNNRKE